jgi:branched-subunit amino acid ABC-type transport system permease component
LSGRNATISIPIVIGAALAGGGVFVIYCGVVNVADGVVPSVKVSSAAILDGIGSLPAALFGALSFGLIEVFWSSDFHRRLQGRRGVQDSRDHGDIPALRHSGPARSEKV